MRVYGKTAQGMCVPCLSCTRDKSACTLEEPVGMRGNLCRRISNQQEVQLLGYTIHDNPVFVIFCNAVDRVVKLMQSPWMQHMSTLQGGVDWCL